MGQNKLKKFEAIDSYNCVLQYPYSQLMEKGFPYKGNWRGGFFKQDAPIVLELGCGRGEYTVALAQENKEKLFIGVDKKGARIWAGATIVEESKLQNVAFLRTDIGLIKNFFSSQEVDEIWLTFPDPQMKKTKARLISSKAFFLYSTFLQNNGKIHLKTDSNFLYNYTISLLAKNNITPILETSDLYGDSGEVLQQIPNIKTQFEKQWLSRGKKIKYVSFYLPPCPKEGFLEPDEEPEHDDYHSAPRGYQRKKEDDF